MKKTETREKDIDPSFLETKTLLSRVRAVMKNAMRAERWRAGRELRRLGNSAGTPRGQKKIASRLHTLEKKLRRSARKKSSRQSRIPLVSYPDSLPIAGKKDEIIDAIRSSPVVVITGETGSGKTTQIPKMCIEAGRGVDGIIGCTQPRRIAAITVSQRIAQEMGESLGRSVGYKIRFDDRSNADNFIKVMTDGILLMETQADPLLNDYDTLIVDEAHERSINIDFILGILKQLLKRRKDLTVIITSATIDTEKFSRAFDNAPIIEVSGRMYPVEVRYAPIDESTDEQGDGTHIDAAVRTVSELKKDKRREDILIFMPTEQDIRETCDTLAARHYRDTTVMPLFARLPAGDQQRVFHPAEGQKIVVATNVAETSITIPGITYVIDTGLARISDYSPATRTKRLPVKAISKSSADQRKGRCGRVQNGICIRLYPETDYEARNLYTSPEILRSNLAEVILRMISLRMNDVAHFPFIDPPSRKSITDGYDILEELGAIQKDTGKKGRNPSYHLTDKGKIMARMPIDPRISRMIIEAQHEHCINDVLIVASALSIQDPRERPVDREAQADEIHRRFVNPSSDFITLLNIWNEYHRVLPSLKTRNKIRKFCKEQYLSYRRMREWKDVYDQIATILKEEGIASKRKNSLTGETLYAAVHKAILSGYLSNIAVKEEKNVYKKAKGKEIMLFPGSGLFNRGGDWIVAAELIETSRLFARTVAIIKSEWLEEVGGDLCRYTWAHPRWDTRRGEVVASERVTLYGLTIVEDRTVSYGSIHPEEAARVFIRQALVEDGVEASFPFLAHNRELVETITTLEDKVRKRDILASDDDLADFYARRLSGVYDIRTLKRMIVDRGGDDFLKMREEDIKHYDPGEELRLYPDRVSLGNTALPCTYRFAPGNPDDGVTVQIPQSVVASVPLDATDWIVPGLLEEKITALVRGLPKQHRKKLVPIAETVTIITREMKWEQQPLLSSLGQFLYNRFGVDIPSSAWPDTTLPNYLKMRIAVVDEKGREVFASRDINDLPDRFVDGKGSPAFRKARSAWEKKDLSTWNFGTLPPSIDLQRYGGMGEHAYPALAAEDGAVAIRLFRDRQEADATHREGTVALYERHFKKELQYLKKTLALRGATKTWATYFGGVKKLENAIYRRVVRILFDHPVRSDTEFFTHADTVKPRILVTGQELLQEIEPVLKAYDETRSTLHALETANRSIKPAVTFLVSLRNDLNRLLPESFLERYNSDRLHDLPRYLKAIVIRAKRGIAHLEKDQLKSREFTLFYDTLQELRNAISAQTSDEKKQAIEELAWMVEEYKVSLFAQELKTPFPISRKRLEKKIQEIARLV